CPRMLVTYSSKFCFSVADGLVATHNSIDSGFALGLESGDTSTRIGQFICKTFCFEFSFRVLTRGSLPFMRQAFSLLHQSLKRTFQLSSNFPQTLRHGSLR